jgi:hypothetical protein
VKSASPLVYVATTLCRPAERKVKLQGGTTPLLNAKLRHNVVDVVLSTKVTIPVGTAVPVKVGVTVAVKVTCWLTVGKLGVEDRLVVVPEAVKISWSVCVPVGKFVSPL